MQFDSDINDKGRGPAVADMRFHPQPQGDNLTNHGDTAVHKGGLFNRISGRLHRRDAVSPSVAEDGSIKDLRMPRDWMPAMTDLNAPYGMIGAPLLKEYNPGTDASTKMCYWNRSFGGAKESPETASAFNRVLSHEPHKLNNQELKSLGHLIGNGTYGNSEQFDVIGAETKKIHGRTVLAVESAYKNDEGQISRRSYGVFINSDGTGRHVEQVYYSAPESTYRANLQEAKECMEAIKWRKNMRPQ